MSGSSCRAVALAAVLAVLSFAARGAAPLQQGVIYRITYIPM
jgi:hypothetical protein